MSPLNSIQNWEISELATGDLRDVDKDDIYLLPGQQLCDIGLVFGREESLFMLCVFADRHLQGVGQTPIGHRIDEGFGLRHLQRIL